MRKTILIISLNLLINIASAANDKCSIVSQTNLNFNCALSNLANCQAIGNIALECRGNRTLTLTLSQGNSSSFTQRSLINQTYPSQKLNYNVYTTANKSNVFGDGSQGTSTINLNCSKKGCIANFYAYIATSVPQLVWEGTYSDNLVLTIDF